MTLPKDLVTLLKKHESFCIVSHKEPDGDAVASSVVLGSLLSRIGKNILLCSPGPFIRKEIQEYEDIFLTEIPEDFMSLSPVLLALDASTQDRLGSFSVLVNVLTTAMIDHHTAGTPFGQIRYVDPEASSTSELIYPIAAALGLDMTREEKEMLLLGVLTDTGFFRHLEEGSGRVLSLAAKLSEDGVSLNRLFYKIYGDKPLESRQLLGETLSSLEPLFQGRVIFAYEEYKPSRSYDPSLRDSDITYQILQTTEACGTVVYIRQEKPDTVSVGLRSDGSIDVGTLARNYGGGGHIRAASFNFSGTLKEIRNLLLKDLEKLLEANNASGS